MSAIKPIPIFAVGDYGPGGAGAHVTHWTAAKLKRAPEMYGTTGAASLEHVKVSRFWAEPDGSFWRMNWWPGAEVPR